MDSPVIPKRPSRKSTETPPAASPDAAVSEAEPRRTESFPLVPPRPCARVDTTTPRLQDDLVSAYEEASDGEKTPPNTNTTSFKTDSDFEAAGSDTSRFNDDQETVAQDKEDAEDADAEPEPSDVTDEPSQKITDLNGPGLNRYNRVSDAPLSNANKTIETASEETEKTQEISSVMPIIPKRPTAKLLASEPESTVSARDTESEAPIIPRRPKAHDSKNDFKTEIPKVPSRPERAKSKSTEAESAGDQSVKHILRDSTEEATSSHEASAPIAKDAVKGSVNDADDDKKDVAPAEEEAASKLVEESSERESEVTTTSSKAEVEEPANESDVLAGTKEQVKTEVLHIPEEIETDKFQPEKPQEAQHDSAPVSDKPRSETDFVKKDEQPVNPPAIPSKRPVRSKVDSPTPVETSERKKAPPPKPKKLSSKIAAFQQMLSQPQPPVEESSSEGEKPPRPASSRSKLSSSHLQFAQNLRGIMGRGVALPGMVDPSALQRNAEEESHDDATEEKPQEPVRRAKGPRGKRLPKALATPISIEQESKFTPVTFHLWDLEFTKKEEPILEEKAVQSSKQTDSEDKQTQAENEIPPVEDYENFADNRKKPDVEVFTDSANSRDLSEIIKIESSSESQLRSLEEPERLEHIGSESEPQTSQPQTPGAQPQTQLDFVNDFEEEEEPVITDEIRKIESASEEKIRALETSEVLSD